MKGMKHLFWLLPLIVIFAAGCAGYKGGMEDQTGGAESADSEYTDFAAKKAMEAAKEEEERKKAAEQQEQIQQQQGETQGETQGVEEGTK